MAIGRFISGGMDPIGRLVSAMRQASRDLEGVREVRSDIVAHLGGSNYGGRMIEWNNPNFRDSTYLNLLEMTVGIYARSLAARNPGVLVTTPYPALKPAAYELMLAMNHVVKEMGLGEILFSVVMDAIITMGVAKVGLRSLGEVGMLGERFYSTEMFVSPVSLQDYVHDTSASRFDQVTFIGDRYRLPLEFVKETKEFNRSVREEAIAIEGARTDELGNLKASSLSQGQLSPSEYIPFTEVWDVFLPLEEENGAMVTLLADEGGSPVKKVLREVPWEGPFGGPYHRLSFSDIPDNIIPNAPALHLLNLHELINRLYTKLGSQADRQKKFVGALSEATDDGVRIADVSDGEAIRLDRPGETKEFELGGISRENLAFAMHLLDRFSWKAGNLDALGGLGPQSDTVGQEALMAQSSARMVQDMQDRMLRFTQKVLRDLAWYVWEDPVKQIPIVKKIPGIDGEILEISRVFSADRQRGHFLDYAIDIEPYSMQDQTPAFRLQNVLTLYERVLLPALPFLQQRGIEIDFEGLLKLWSKLSNMNELQDLLNFSNPEQAQPAGPQERARQSPTTTRTNVRVNRPGATRQGKEEVLQNVLLGSRKQGSETQSFFRNIG